jgi:hypothetical protein
MQLIHRQMSMLGEGSLEKIEEHFANLKNPIPF